MTDIGVTTVDAPPQAPPPDVLWTVHQRDARHTREFLAQVATQRGAPEQAFVTATITSPPYANLVNYGSSNQIGFGQSYEDYLNECEQIFSDVHQYTVEEGSLWLIADTLMGTGQPGAPTGLLPLPFALADRAARHGWILREVIIWRKDRTRPWAGPGRLRNGFEYILYFVKTSKFKHHVERVRDVRSLRSWWVKYPERHNPWGMTPDNVWEIPIPVQGSWASTELRHACPFPEELVRRILLLSTDEGDVVFDPFSGSGMVAATAEKESRLPLGTELSAEFCRIYADVIRPNVLTADRPIVDVDAADMTGTLLTLRVLKYPKDLIRQLLRTGEKRAALLGAYVEAAPFEMTPRSTDYGAVECKLVLPDNVSQKVLDETQDRVTRAELVAPLSKYGLAVHTQVIRLQQLGLSASPDRTFAAYIEGRTWNAQLSVLGVDVNDWLLGSRAQKFPPILSPMEIHQSLEE